MKKLLSVLLIVSTLFLSIGIQACSASPSVNSYSLEQNFEKNQKEQLKTEKEVAQNKSISFRSRIRNGCVNFANFFLKSCCLFSIFYIFNCLVGASFKYSDLKAEYNKHKDERFSSFSYSEPSFWVELSKLLNRDDTLLLTAKIFTAPLQCKTALLPYEKI